MTASSSYSLRQGTSPLLVSMPHIGTHIPPELRAHYMPRALALEDTDWHLERLYDCVPQLGASLLCAQISRYVIDQNRPPDDAPMYPGASNTELCPTRFFTGEPLYQDGCAPAAPERARRRSLYWEPYHQALQAEPIHHHRRRTQMDIRAKWFLPTDKRLRLATGQHCCSHLCRQQSIAQSDRHALPS